MNVITGSKDLKFRVQGKRVDSENPVNVTMDHNVWTKLKEGTLVEVKKPKPTKPAPEIKK